MPRVTYGETASAPVNTGAPVGRAATPLSVRSWRMYCSSDGLDGKILLRQPLARTTSPARAIRRVALITDDWSRGLLRWVASSEEAAGVALRLIGEACKVLRGDGEVAHQVIDALAARNGTADFGDKRPSFPQRRQQLLLGVGDARAGDTQRGISV